MIELQNITKSYQNRLALGSVTLAIPSGSTTVLIGPSGCGKSTLLRTLIGLIIPDRGSVRFHGSEVGAEDISALRHRTGYVIQDGGLFPHLTVLGNLALLPRTLGWKPERIHSRALELCELTHFPAEALDRWTSQLSGGQRQRVSLMRALMLDPELLLLDEPLGALDPMIRRDLQEDLRRIFRTLGKTVVLVTHDLGEAGFFADSIVLLREGRVVQQGSLEDLVQRPETRFVSEFVNAQRSPLESLRSGLDGDLPHA